MENKYLNPKLDGSGFYQQQIRIINDEILRIEKEIQALIMRKNMMLQIRGDIEKSAQFHSGKEMSLTLKNK